MKQNLHRKITMEENITRRCRKDKSFHFSQKIFSVQIERNKVLKHQSDISLHFPLFFNASLHTICALFNF
jgi:hypothetical protein